MRIKLKIDIESLRAFVTVLDIGGVTKAASRLNLSQSAISHKLSRLEDQLGRKILVKDKHKFLPTPDGQELLSYAQKLVALHDEMTDQYRLSNIDGAVRIGATEDATAQKLSTVIARFNRVHPQVSLSIRVAQSLTLDQYLQQEKIDCAILQVFEDEMKTGDIALWNENLVWVKAKDMPTPQEQKIPFVSFDENCFYRQTAQHKLSGLMRSLNVVLECPSAAGVRAGVVSGLGIALISGRNLTDELEVIHSNLPHFPRVCHVLRFGKSVSKKLEESLSLAITNEMQEPFLENRN